MVVILIVHPESPFPLSRGEQLSSTSISFVSSSSSSQVEPDSSLATTKEEEWVTKKKVELTTKRQVETRVKRQVVLEDGKVVEDSGPIVTTNTTEDTEKQESSQTEHRQLGDDEPDNARAERRVVVPGLVKEVNEKTVKTREEKEERLETEDVQHLGDISDDAYQSAVSQGGGDLRLALLGHRTSPEGRVVHQSTSTKRTVNTDDRRHLSELRPDGRVVTETLRTTEHEQVNNTEEPDDGRGSGGEEEETHKLSSQHYRKTKDQEFVEYLADGKRIGGEMRYEAENVEGDRQGDPSLLAVEHHEWESLSDRVRKMRRNKLQKEGLSPLDRKDALTKKPLNFDQEEETRKVETSKWLEHHFGSESRSSKDSIGDDDDLPQTGTSTSFINVTMKSTKNKAHRTASPPPRSLEATAGNSSSGVFVSETETPPPTNYFQGISEWKTQTNKEYRPERPSRKSFNSPTSFKDRVQVLPTGPNHSFATSKSSPSPPYPSSSIGSKNFRGSQGSNLNGRNSSGPESSSPFQSLTEKHLYNRYYRQTNGRASSEDELPPHRPASPRRYNGHLERDERFSEEQLGLDRPVQREPAPDYSPPSPRATPPPLAQDVKKKVYQRTRFAADIPPARKAAQSTQTPHKTRFGESFRKFVGKFRSRSKEKRRSKKGSRSPSPNTYQSYPLAGGGSEDSGDSPRQLHLDAGTQTMRRSGDPVVHKYYLGEDPFGGSIYGREREYDGVTPFRRRLRRPSDALEDDRNARNQYLTTNGGSTSTLGRLSKSTSRLVADPGVPYEDRGGVQTLPRKLHGEHKAKKQVYVTKSNAERASSSPASWESQRHGPNSHSMINVSIVNKTSPPPSTLGPAKPARTYRSALLRSQSFNAHAGDTGLDFHAVHKSNPQLHRLDETPPPLKSPGIVTSVSRSTKDISQAVNDEDNYRRVFNYSDPKSPGHLNGYSNSRTIHDTKKRIFMKSLQDKAPELFKTLHGTEGSQDLEDRGRIFTSTPLRNGHRVVEYSNSFRSSNTSSPTVNGSDRVHSPSSPTYTTSITHSPSIRTNGEVVNRSVVRRGSHDDYSETVRITSKSDDPLRPSVTNTVQSFSKKTLPVKGGRGKETIESSETKTVTKSRYHGGDHDLKYHERSKYTPTNGGVVIQVRNNQK